MKIKFYVLEFPVLKWITGLKRLTYCFDLPQIESVGICGMIVVTVNLVINHDSIIVSSFF